VSKLGTKEISFLCIKQASLDNQIRSTLVHLPVGRIVFRPVKWSDSAYRHEGNIRPVGELVTESLIQVLSLREGKML